MKETENLLNLSNENWEEIAETELKKLEMELPFLKPIRTEHEYVTFVFYAYKFHFRDVGEKRSSLRPVMIAYEPETEYVYITAMDEGSMSNTRQGVRAGTRLLYGMHGVPDDVFMVTGRNGYWAGIAYDANVYGYKLKYGGSVPEKILTAIQEVLRKMYGKEYFWNAIESAVEVYNLRMCTSKPTSTIESAYAEKAKKLKGISGIPDYREYIRVTPQQNYHIEVDAHFYSVPYYFYGEMVNVIVADDFLVIEDLCGVIICCHRRIKNDYQLYCTVPEHMPTPDDIPIGLMSGEGLKNRAAAIGEAAQRLISYIIDGCDYEMQGYLECDKLLNEMEKCDRRVVEFAAREEIETINRTGEKYMFKRFKKSLNEKQRAVNKKKYPFDTYLGV